MNFLYMSRLHVLFVITCCCSSMACDLVPFLNVAFGRRVLLQYLFAAAAADSLAQLALARRWGEILSTLVCSSCCRGGKDFCVAKCCEFSYFTLHLLVLACSGVKRLPLRRG